MYKYILTLFAFLYFGITTAIGQVLCFKSGTKDKSIQLQLTLPEERSKQGKIRYGAGAYDIEIYRTKEVILSEIGVIPATVRTEFSEILNGKKRGYIS